MKIICTDNFNRETVSDFLVAENLNEYHAKRIVTLLNASESESTPNYYKAVADDHKLYKFEP